MRIDQSFQRIRMSKIVEVSERARDLAPAFEARTGLPFVYFQRGEVGSAPPPFLAQEIADAIAKGFTKYPKAGGEPVYKQAIAEKIAREDGVDVTAANVLATMGGQEGLQLVFSLMRGGTCAGFTPAWSCVFDNIFPFTQTTFIPVPLLADKGWAIDFSRLEKVLKGVDSFYFNSPHNPTGRVFTAEEIERVHGLCKKNNVLMIADEAYRELVYEGTHISPLTLDRDGGVVSVNTFSKSLAVTGLRVGYTVCRDKGLIEMLAKGEYTQTAGVPTPFQHAFAKAVSHPDLPAWMKQYRASMTDRRAALVAGLDPSLRASAPQGAFYCFVDLRDEHAGLSQVEATAQAEQLAVDLLTTAGVAVVPGSAFGSDFAGYARLSYSTLSPAAITDGARRLGRAIAEARGRRTGVAAAR